ncbi:Exoskeleton protein RP43 [Lamellibrachia satsuma]|nr:Exoskeleton protein RP43 [Lamellibrachia satsuma]
MGPLMEITRRVRGRFKSPETPRWKVRLHFTKFNLEFGNNNCPYDWVKVYGGSSTSALLIGKYCGTNMPADVISPASTAYVAFKTDFSVTRPGFRIRYSLVSCSKLQVLTGLWGYIYTLGSHYENYETCSWRIQAPANKRVRIYFISFNLEFHSSCLWDWVKIYDGSSANAPLIGKYCGTNKPAGLIYSSGNSMFVTFRSDHSITKPGFRIKYWRVT